MTECERIVAEGTLPECFFEEETRSGFLVTKERKKLWAIQLDLLLKFDEVCQKNGFQYQLTGGSLLGAIRHKGFIPWDDDIDVLMPREDYQKLLAIGAGAFAAPYFLQAPGTDHGYFYAHTKLRNSRTAEVIRTFQYEKFNQGISIDIFPLDHAKKDDLQERYDKIKNLILENSTNMRRSNPNPTDADLRRMKMYPYRDPMEVWKELDAAARKYEHEDTGYWNMAVCTIYKADELFFQEEWVNTTIPWEFELFKFPIPKEYDKMLATQYGDYMQLPPVEKRGAWHTGAITDPDVPYTKYLR